MWPAARGLGVRPKVTKYLCYYRIEGTGRLIEKADKYLEACEVHNMSNGTVGTYAYCLVSLFRWLKNSWEKFERFTQKDLQDWMVALKAEELSPRTINQRLCCACGFREIGILISPERRVFDRLLVLDHRGQMILPEVNSNALVGRWSLEAYENFSRTYLAF